MKIKSLRMVNFRRFADEQLTFNDGLNLVRGPNESGKSTVVRALMVALFEKPATTSSRTRLDARWGAAEEPWLELVFTDEEGEYRLIKDFGAKKVLLQPPGDAKPLASQKAVDARISEMLGFRDPAQYLRTACVTHDQMTSLGEDAGSAKKLAGMLREVIIGSTESAAMEKAVRTLGADIDELKRGMERPTNNPGTIRRLHDEREMYMSRQKDLSVGATDFAEQRERLDEVEQLLEKKTTREADLANMIDKNKTLQQIEREYDEAQRRFEVADRTQDKARELDRIDRRIAESFPGFDELDPGADVELKKEIEIRTSLKSLTDEIASEKKVSEPTPAARAERGRQPRPKVGGLASLAGGVLMVVLGIVLGAAVHPALFALIAPGVVLLALGTYFLARSGRPGKEAAPPEEPEAPEPEQEPDLEESLGRAGAKIDRLEAKERAFLETAGCKDPDEFFSRFESYCDLAAERRETATGLKALLGGRTLEQVESDRRKAAIAVSACDEKLAELAAFKAAPTELEAAIREHSALVKELSELETERDGLSFHLLKTASDPEDALKIEEVVSWLWEAEQSARRRLRVSGLARDAMRQASEKMLSSAVPILADSVGQTFSRLTNGRYQDVEVSESDLAISVYSPEKSQMIEADDLLPILSRGTASQLYLSARLELVGLLSGGMRPPLIFDDSFSYFDGQRLASLWAVLEEVSNTQQVLLFTCTDRYDKLAADVNVIDLTR
jgi:DNA repair exonuclease SbcCD ATPase subunit